MFSYWDASKFDLPYLRCYWFYVNLGLIDPTKRGWL